MKALDLTEDEIRRVFENELAQVRTKKGKA
jgi:hypothetical protein